jgi:hypothetical protein
MTEDRLKIDELTARLTVDPKFVKDLLAEMAAQITKEYLTIEEMAQRLSWEEKTVKKWKPVSSKRAFTTSAPRVFDRGLSGAP